MRAPWQAAGAHKLIPSDGWAEELGVRMRLVDTRAETTKLAGTIFGSTYDELRPPKGHTGVHLVAYGDFERWGANRNGDSFPTAASRRYHDTFTKYARVYRNHANKDPRKAIGDVLRSAHDPIAHRVELFVAMHNDKAGAELQRLATEGELPWSMGCKVPGDRCSVCDRFRKNASDPRQCADVRDHLGDVLADGRVVAVHNDNPLFYDISTVPRGADRTAFSLKVAGAWGAIRGAATCEPDEQFLRHFTDDSERELRRHEMASKMAAAQSRMRSPWLYSGGQAYFDQLVMKAARTPFTDAHVEIMRKAPPGDLWRKLAAAGVILPADAFFACAFHGDDDFQACKEAALAMVRSGTFAALRGLPAEKMARTNAYFDLDAPQFTGYQWAAGSNAVAGLVDKLSANAFDLGAARLCGSDAAPVSTLVPGTANAFWDEQALEAVGAYAAYKLSAVQAIESIHPTVDHALLLDLAAAQDLVN